MICNSYIKIDCISNKKSICCLLIQIRVEEAIGDLYKVRVGFHGDKESTEWYKDYNLAPCWFVEKVGVILHIHVYGQSSHIS